MTIQIKLMSPQRLLFQAYTDHKLKHLL